LASQYQVAVIAVPLGAGALVSAAPELVQIALGQWSLRNPHRLSLHEQHSHSRFVLAECEAATDPTHRSKGRQPPLKLSLSKLESAVLPISSHVMVAISS
jgi:hypothetical protein